MDLDRRKLLLLAGAAAVAPSAGIAANWLPRPPWKDLTRRLGPLFQPVESPLVAARGQRGVAVDTLFANLKNPYFIGGDPALTQTLGWTDGWTSRPSRYVVSADSAADVAAAVDFARRHRVKVAVKGGGHSYFGNSNAADSLLLWTKRMKRIEQHDAFVAGGAPSGTAPVTAVTVAAGCLWGEVYRDTAVRHNRYVQGGGCLTVGVGGFVLGGGFGSFSKAYGTGAANLVEAEIVTADGRVRTVSKWRDPELFFALRGGGGGSFGIVTHLTLQTFPLPDTIGAVLFELTARDAAAWRALVDRMMKFYADRLMVPAWGEQIRFAPGRRLAVTMAAIGLTKAEIEATWAPLFGWIKSRGDDYAMKAEPLLMAVPAQRFWDTGFLKSLPGLVVADDRPGASPDNILWAGNVSEAGQILHAYKSRWLPERLLADGDRAGLVDAIVAGSSEWAITLHTNKGLAGGSPAARARVAETATNKQVLGAFALLIVAAEGPPAWPGIPGHEPDVAGGRREAAGVACAFAPFAALVPDGGCYLSEADYFGRDWKSAYWGDHYPRLLRAKRRYDPTNIFTGHHCVGE